MTDTDCIFCKIALGQISAVKLYEDQVILAFLDTGPISDGHTLVIPKEHFAGLHQCTHEVLTQITSKIGKIARAVVDAVQADGYNLLCNNGPAAGQLVEHLHFHIIPRNTGDKLFDRWPAYEYEKGKAETIAEKIRRKL